jgi:hypothetical protein
MVKRTIVHGVVPIVLVVSCVAWSDRNRERGSPLDVHSASIIVMNNTLDPICVYLDGRFIGECRPFVRQTIRTRVFGKVRLLGRLRCDTWGPDEFTLAPGRSTTWRLGESNRHGR